LPKHVAIIMDGNSRWAESRGLPAWVGHERGVAALRAAVIAAREWGIPALSVRLEQACMHAYICVGHMPHYVRTCCAIRDKQTSQACCAVQYPATRSAYACLLLPLP
jgi:hypothetical protein